MTYQIRLTATETREYDINTGRRIITGRIRNKSARSVRD